jgi:hypothetical protein
VKIFQARSFVNVKVSFMFTSFIFGLRRGMHRQYILNVWIRMAGILLQDLVGVGGMWCFFTHGS